MGIKRLKVHILTLFSLDHKVCSNWPKNVIASHEDFYMRICVKIFSEGRRQDFSIDHKIFQTDQKIANTSNDKIYQKYSVYNFSEGRLQEK